MKIRSGFVSNSSSSSFMCDVCGRTESGWDACLRDFGMVECVNGHEFCEEHLLAKAEAEKHDENDEEEEEDEYEVAEKRCPLCQMRRICKDDIIKYVYKKFDIDNEKLSVEIREKFATYKQFQNYLWPKQ